MIITLDGPAGAGKSSVARALARRLHFEFLDTGAMYRAVAWSGRQAGVDWNKPQELVAVVEKLLFRQDKGRFFVGDEEITEAIRTPEITALTRFAANNPLIRRILVELQRSIARGKKMVSEGRDQGTVVFPEAECKFYLQASPECRARRRLKEMEEKGEKISFDELLARQNFRDQEDSSRSEGPLQPAHDAFFVDTDELTLEEVVDTMEALVKKKIPQLS